MLRRVLARSASEGRRTNDRDPNNLEAIVERLVECAKEGQSWAIAQAADRLEGRPAQMLEHAGGGDVHVIVMSGLVREQQTIDADFEEAETAPATKLIGGNGGNGSNGHGSNGSNDHG